MGLLYVLEKKFANFNELKWIRTYGTTVSYGVLCGHNTSIKFAVHNNLSFGSYGTFLSQQLLDRVIFF